MTAATNTGIGSPTQCVFHVTISPGVGGVPASVTVSSENEGGPRNDRALVLKRRTVPEVRALEAIKRHDGARAVAALEGSRSYDFAYPFTLPYVRGLAYLAASQAQQAAAEFQKIIDHPGVNPPSPVHSLARLGLARAYAMAGDEAKARTAYQDFFVLWKDADPDVPVIQAKAEYAKLQ